MLFNSFEFLLFLPIVFCLYWFVFNKNLKWQNALVLVASYFFYGWWDWRFLGLIFLSTVVDYFVGLAIEKQEEDKKRKRLLYVSVFFNLGVLGFFKYFNFFIESWQDLLTSIGYEAGNTWTLKIILPVGISFYTFQTMSYTIDIYRKNLKPTEDFISFAAFVSFFPQLVAGPIERATNLLPQIEGKRTFKYEQSVEGLRLILWGMFKKVVIADSLAPYVNDIFANYQTYDGGTLWLGAIYFAFQIYCDFSGYSDIAIGAAKLFGFELMTNFKFPYFSRNIGEFWRRWHISLSTWFRDYLYIPLGGSRAGKWKSIRNVFIIFLVSGFWHGANWTFIVWGGIHALLFVPSFVLGTNRKFKDSDENNKSLREKLIQLLLMARTFFFVTIAWVFFRSESLASSLHYLIKVFSEVKNFPFNFKENAMITLLLVVDVIKSYQFNFEIINSVINFKFLRRISFLIEMTFNAILFILILLSLNTNSSNSFIYFQF